MTTRHWLPGLSRVSAAVLMLAVAVAYIERTTISHALPFIIDEAHLTKSESGLILSGFGFGYVLSLPFSGWIIQKLGHAATLRWLSIGWLVSAIGFSFADNYASMFLARLVLGVFEGPLFPLFVSWLSLSTKSESRPVAIGFIESCSYVGMAFAGPITVGIAQSSNWRMAYACVGAMALVVSLASFRLQEPRKFEGQPEDPLAPPKAKRNRQVLVSSALIAMGFLLYNTAKSFYSTWFPTILVKGFGQTSADAAMVTLIQSLAAPLASLAVAAASV